ncbi:MAG: FadR family transcriptional regulator [Rhizorhabdus sp.]|nr:FadR family transcriptional regulator [Rhizorhabdus sp.]
MPKAPSSASSSTVRMVATRIRQDVLAMEDGAFLGSEDELVVRYGVSRPTLRQAATILGQEQLLVSRRGVGGGYFARIPDTRGVAQSAAVYLLAHHTSMEEVIAAVAPIKAELAILACRCTDETLKEEMVAFAEQPLPDEVAYDYFLRSERTFARILGPMSGNGVLALFLNILYDFCSRVQPENDVYRHQPGRRKSYTEARTGMVKAIIAADEEIAAVYAKRCANMVAKWMIADHAANTPKKADGSTPTLSKGPDSIKLMLEPPIA